MLMTTSPTGSGAKYWRTMCGSWAVHGLYGSSLDYFTEMYLCCTSADSEPTEIRVSADVMSSFRSSMAQRSVAFDVASSTMRQIIDAAIKRLRDDGRIVEQSFCGARVILDREVNAGTALFYIGSDLVGETTGWVA